MCMSLCLCREGHWWFEVRSCLGRCSIAEEVRERKSGKVGNGEI